MEGLDPERLAQSQPMDLMAEVLPVVTGGRIAWTVVGAPTKGWADSIGVSDVLALWDAVAVAMRLDEADPVSGVARRTSPSSSRERTILNGHAFDRIRYQGPGTDVTSVSTREIAVGRRLAAERGRRSSSCRTCRPRRCSCARLAPCGGHRPTTAAFFLSSMGTMVEGLELDSTTARSPASAPAGVRPRCSSSSS